MPATVRLGKISDSYLRYIGPLGEQIQAHLGENRTTHVASVCMDPDQPMVPGRSVVKFFHLSDKGWLNEYAAWTMAQILGVRVPPKAALLVGSRSDITDGHGPELKQATKHVSTPLVLWCTSAMEPHRNIQTALGRSWESSVLKTEAGRRIAAMDGWLGNCDRIASNLLWWASESGALMAIDHEKAAFNQDWTLKTPEHLDEPSADGTPARVRTHLIDHIQHARKSNDKKTRQAASGMANAISALSKHHPDAWKAFREDLAVAAGNNFGPAARDRLLSFLDYRVTEDSINRRLGLVI